MVTGGHIDQLEPEARVLGCIVWGYPDRHLGTVDEGSPSRKPQLVERDRCAGRFDFNADLIPEYVATEFGDAGAASVDECGAANP